MNWETVVQLIITYGIDQAYKIWQIAKAGDPDEAAWEQLRALSLKTYEDYIAEAKVRQSQQAETLPPPPDSAPG